MTCKECLHFSLCEYNTNVAGDSEIKLFYDTGAEKCSFFKNKADYVEVVRCGKCKHGEKYVIDNDTFLYKCRKIGISGFTEDFYCSYGERSDT